MIEIEPASLGQVIRGRAGKLFYIEDDVSGVAQELQKISKELKLAYNDQGGFFVVYQSVVDGDGQLIKEHLVTTAQECDQRLVKRVREITHQDYDYAKDLEERNDKAEAEKDYKFSQIVGEMSEQLAHALRKDYFGSDTGKYFYPKDIPND